MKPYFLFIKPIILVTFFAINPQSLLFAEPEGNDISQFDHVVAEDGSGDFTSVQEAIDASRSYPPERVRIFIKNGTYREKVTVHSWNTKLSLIGEDKQQTRIVYDDYFDRIDRGRNSTFHTFTLRVDANDFRAENLTIENDAGPVGQALALFVEGDRAVFENCRFLGHQDTIFTAGEGARHFFKDSYIEGTTDYVFGPGTAVFENCHLHSKRDSYITAASTPEGEPFGLVFKNCRLTADEDVSEVYLGRPWRDFARTVFIASDMGSHIKSEGWHNWGRPEAEETIFYAEYHGEHTPDGRVPWAKFLSEEEVQTYTLENIFRGWAPDENKK